MLFFVALAAALYSASNIFLGLFLALVISSGLEVAVNFLERRGISRTLGVIALFLVIVLFLALLVYLLIPLVLDDLNSVIAAQRQSPVVRSWIQEIVGTKVATSIASMIEKVASESLQGTLTLTPWGVFTELVGGVGLAAAVLVSSFYLSLSRDGVERFIRAVFPRDSEGRALDIYARSRRKIGYWFQSQILLSFLMGFLVWSALFFLGVKHALLLGVLAGVLELVPFVGPIISGAVAILFALLTSPTLALYTLIVFLVIHQFEAHVLVPLLFKKAVDLHPVIVIMSLLVGVQIGGIMGALVAVPAAAVLQEVLESRARAATA